MSELLRLHVVPGGHADQPPKQPAASEPEPLWREVLGEHLRGLRREHQESLAETARRAGISPQYLSEVERGLKEPSSEMIAAVAGALGTTLGGLAESVAEVLRLKRQEAALSRVRRELPTRRRSSGGPVLLALAA
ncbi:transcriptional regulator with XRE-family HTH domain [Catenulispora sp. GAS73]|uniref:helix-turn-helix domain-containing protein n=1 Tax=Catenulispora sp. GAS73 TaxID=3156269 RepID=UPI0035160EDB